MCDTSPKKGKQCTLRAAIEEANDTPGPDVINFKIGGTAAVKTISPTSPLPAITDPVTINGYSQPRAKANTKTSGNNAVLKIQLDGTNAGAGANGLTITAGSSTVRGLVINRFSGDGIRLETGGNNTTAGNFIGTDSAGTSALGNAGNGVSIDGSSDRRFV